MNSRATNGVQTPDLDAVRAAFERWAEDEGYPISMERHASPPTYRDPRTHAAWGAWWKQATSGVGAAEQQRKD